MCSIFQKSICFDTPFHQRFCEDNKYSSQVSSLAFCNWKTEKEFLIADDENGLKKGLEDNSEMVVREGDNFVVKLWTTQWWDMHCQGIGRTIVPLSNGVPVQNLPASLKTQVETPKPEKKMNAIDNAQK